MDKSFGAGFFSAAFLFFLSALALPWGWGAAAQSAAAPPPAFSGPSTGSVGTTGDGVSVNGFRSANFGMTEAEVRGAIRRDFKLGPEAIRTETNPGEFTTVMVMQVNDLLPNTGQARLSYIFGYQSKRLIQVTVSWGGVVTPSLSPAATLDIAKLLAGYFVAAGYRPDTVVQNVRAGEGITIIFRGQDARGRMTLLALTELPKQAETSPPTAPYILQLSYILDVRNPDVFRIRRGQF